MKKLLLIALAATALSATGATAQNLVTNGGFELDDPNAGTQFVGWTATNNHLHTWNGSQDPHSGNFNAAFGSILSNPDTLSQGIATMTGSLYNISFWVNSDDADSTFTAAFGGTTLLSLSGVAFGYTEYTFSNVLATSALTQLTFTGSNPPGHVNLDDIAVTFAGAGAVPEPATWAMMISGMGAVGGAMRRRRLANKKCSFA